MVKSKINWKAYNEELVNRGKINFYLTEDLLCYDWYAKIDEERKKGKSGRKYIYSHHLIKVAMLIKTAFNLTYRQTEGKLNSFISLIADKNLKVPDYTSIAKRAKYVIKELDQELKKVNLQKDNVHVLIDSSGLKIMRTNEWSLYKQIIENKVINNNNNTLEIQTVIKLHICIDAVSHAVFLSSS